MAGKRAIRLNCVQDVRKLLSRTINGLYRDEMAPEKAAKIGYLAAILLRTFEQTDIVQRLDEFERAIREDRAVTDLSGWN